MFKRHFIQHARKVALFFMTTTIVCASVVNLQFNMTGYSIVSLKVPASFENLKVFLYGSHMSTKSIADVDTVGTNRSLVAVNESLQIKNKKIDRESKQILNIAWYNKPSFARNRYINRFYSSSVCSYNNCRMTLGIDNNIHYTAIIFALHHPLGFEPPISRKERLHDQVWIFFGLEPPGEYDKLAYRHDNWRNTMNWSMSYRLDADIFCPYGMLERRTVETSKNYREIFSRKTKQAAWLVSNCGAQSYRDDFVSELQRFGLNVDIFGWCGNGVVQNINDITSLVHRDYKFYLSFENSLCKDYVTEKFFGYFNLDVILVVRGGADYDRILPNDTFINTGHFKSAEAVSNFLFKVSSSEHLYTKILRNKDKYVAKEVHDMPTSYCSICEKLNNLDDNRKTYEDHVTFIHGNTCWAATDVPIKLSPRLIKDNILTFICLFVLTIYCILVKYEFCKKKK